MLMRSAPITQEVGHIAEADGVIAELAELEAHLADEIERLSRAHAPKGRRPGRAKYRARPLWWWRFKLLSWVHACDGSRAHDSDVLRGLRVVLKQWSDCELLQFLKQIDVMDIQHEVRGRTA